jgi:rare lipoprotein A
MISRPVMVFILLAAVGFVGIAGSGCTRQSPPTRPSTPGSPKPYKVMGHWYQPLSDSNGFKQKGLASWYGKKFHGRKTSNGERYNMYGISAAHKTLPLGTWVRIRHLGNGRTLDVRINDRGPFVRGRIVDLSYGAARKLGIIGPGTARVEIVALGKAGPPQADGHPTYQSVDYQHGNFTIQVGAFADRQNAEQFVQQLDKTYLNAHITPYNDGQAVFYRVRVGKCHTLTQAAEYENHLAKNGFPDAFTVAE